MPAAAWANEVAPVWYYRNPLIPEYIPSIRHPHVVVLIRQFAPWSFVVVSPAFGVTLVV
jgi:hypothetical protein